jgi:hypothetical protein
MKRLITEPLLHFLLIGALIFALYALFAGEDSGPRDDRITVSPGKIQHLAALFARTWQRPPTRRELEGLIDDYVREEVAYREGVALGLDRNDTVVRRRIRQKLDFVAEDLTQADPTEADLQAYLEANQDDFRLDPILSFRHIYLDPGKRNDVEADARDLLITLEGEPDLDAGEFGDRILLEHAYANVTQRDIAALFGPDFAEAIARPDVQSGIESGAAWRGPIPSAYGFHLVCVDRRTAGRLPTLDEIRGAVRREWRNHQRRQAIEAFYQELLARYEVSIEWPEESSTEPPAPDATSPSPTPDLP